MNADSLLLDVNEAASALRISPWTVRAWIRDGKLKPVRLGRRVLLEHAELQRLIELGRQPANEETRA